MGIGIGFPLTVVLEHVPIGKWALKSFEASHSGGKIFQSQRYPQLSHTACPLHKRQENFVTPVKE